MTKEEYIRISQDQSADTLPVVFFFYKLKGGRLNYTQFNYAFSIWLTQRIGIHLLSQIIFYVFTELDKHFKINKYE